VVSRLRSFALIVCVVLASYPAISQRVEKDSLGPTKSDSDALNLKEPQIGLVLEGGAALGLAHIGVIQWMEEHRIPVSYVAGTSMGGLVGSLYATGHGPADMQKLIDGINWDVVMSGEVPFHDLSFRRKEDAAEFPNGLEFGIKKGIRFPEGFNSGHQVGLILDSIAFPYSTVTDFNDLPIPFACVATDLVNRKAHVFRSGSLTEALRSTMSLPGIFTPVRSKDSVMVDGGLLDNLPVDVAQEMGAQLTIAVHLETKPVSPDEPLSSVSVLGNSISVVIAANELRSMQKADVLVSVPLRDYSGTDYKKSAEIIKLGYQAAAAKAMVLSRFSVDEATWQAYVARRDARRKPTPVPQFVEVAGTVPKIATEIQYQLSDDVGKPLDTPQINKQLTHILGDGRFAKIGYQMVEKNGEQGLKVVAVDKDWSPPEVRPLIVIDGSEYDNVQFALGARITFRDLGKFGSEWRNDVVLGSEHGLRSEFYLPFGSDLKWFIAPEGFGFNTQQNYYSQNTLEAVYRNRAAGGAFDFGYTPSRSSEFRIGYKGAYQQLYPTVGALTYGRLEGRMGETSLRYVLDDRDDPVVARSGRAILFHTDWYDANPGATSGFPVSELRASQLFKLNKPSSLFFSAAGGTTFTSHQVGFPPFRLGGGPDLYAYGTNEFLTDQYVLGRAGYMHSLFELPAIIGKNLYAMGLVEGGKLYDLPPGTSTLPADMALGFVVNTLFGPIQVGGGLGATGHYKFFYSIGRTF
jgi:NTE family protein